jgi:(R,R)-butanediol dehydrogenase/meso-butanediol dehydrogenase/diacetyl reductase
MRAARFYGKSDIRIEDVAVPERSVTDDVLVEVLWCGICGTDLHEYLVGPIVTPIEPHPLTGAKLPQTLGHEFSARIVEVGSAVTDLEVGDRVAIMPAIVCNRCEWCRRAIGHLCVRFACTGLSAETGGLSQFAVLKDYQLAALPDSMTDLEGAVVEPASVAAYGVDRAGIRGGDVVLVTGAGPIGVLSALYASAVGASTVVIAEPIRDVPHRPCHRCRPRRRSDIRRAGECARRSNSQGRCRRRCRMFGDHAGAWHMHRQRPTTWNRRADGSTPNRRRSAMGLASHDVTLIGSWCYLITVGANHPPGRVG